MDVVDDIEDVPAGVAVTDAAASSRSTKATGNDFVMVVDLDDERPLDAPRRSRLLCDRRTGVGADGVIRVVRGRP